MKNQRIQIGRKNKEIQRKLKYFFKCSGVEEFGKYKKKN